MNNVLVVGFGNTLRCDDGAGVKAAELIAKRFPGFDSITTQELTPELAETLKSYSCVIFVDAAVDVNELNCNPIHAGMKNDDKFSHSLSPSGLLNLCNELYAHKPAESFFIRIPAENIGFGEELSPLTQKAILECVELCLNF